MLQNVWMSAYGWRLRRLRLGGQFAAECQAFRARENFSRDAWNAYTQERLRDLLLLAFTRVPHYQRIWKGVVTLAQLERFTTRDLSALPPLEKSVARDDPHSLLLDGKPRREHRVLHTSGSTGAPIATYWLPEELQRSRALRETRSCAFAGVSYQMPRATFGGRMIEPDPESTGPFHRFNWAERQVYLSAFHLRPDTAPAYLSALRQHKVRWLTGYCNSIYQLARMAVDQSLEAPSLEAVITTSEKLTPEMRVVIEKAFSTRVFEEYGAVEDVFFASENSEGHKLISPDAGLLEVVDDEFQPCVPGVEGEVLATGFIRPSQPMIRYRIGDWASLEEATSENRRQMPVLREVFGRIEDTVYGPDGRRMVRFHGIFVDQPHVAEGQIIQKSLQHIHVRVVPRPGFGESDKREIVQRLQQRLTSQMRVTVEPVSVIDRTRAGKFKAVVSELSPQVVPGSV